jgi:hypothetical protein
MTEIIEFESFTEEVRKAMELKYPDNKVEIKRVTKNNGVIYTGVCIKDENELIYPTMYLEPFYEEMGGELTDAAVEKMCRVYESRRIGEPLSLNYLKDYEEIRKGLRCKLINYDSNREFLENVPHRLFMDLAIVPYYAFKKDDITALINGEATFVVRISHLEMWNREADTVLEDAISNTFREEEASIVGIYEMLKKLNPAFSLTPDKEAECPMYIMSTKGPNGAVSMMYKDKISEFCDSMNCDVYIIPSSINEVILVPVDNNMEPSMINDMIREINRTQLDAVEVLSDHVYYFERSTGYKEAV